MYFGYLAIFNGIIDKDFGRYGVVIMTPFECKGFVDELVKEGLLRKVELDLSGFRERGDYRVHYGFRINKKQG